MEQNLNDTISKRNIYKHLGRVALPISLQGLIMSSLNLVDNLMVGSLGETELAAVGVAVQAYFVFHLLCYGFCAGCSTFIAQFYGAGDTKNIKKTIGFMITVCFCAALFYFLLTIFAPRVVLRIFTNIPSLIDVGEGYMRALAPGMLFLSFNLPFSVSLRSIQKSHIPLITTSTAFVMNTVLNYVLIFGHFGAPALGVVGAGLATSLARMIETAFLLFVLFRKKTILTANPAEYRGASKEFKKRVAANSINTTLNESLWGLGVTLYSAAYARVSETAFAAVQASYTINDLFMMASFGVGDAALILIGQRLGENRPKDAERYAHEIIKVGIVMGVVIGACVVFLGRPIVSLFNFSQEGSDWTRYMLIIYGFTMVCEVCNAILVTGILRGGGDTRFAMMADVGTVWIYGLPVAFVTTLVFHWPIYFCLLAVQLEVFIKFALVYPRYRSKKWIKNVIEGL